MSNIAIKVENLSKYYKLGVINSGTLSRDLQSWLWKRMGKEDPNKKIGSVENTSEGFWALKDLNFEIQQGDRVGIIGHNGAGKSTLLKMISQISSPTSGRIYIKGKVASLLEVGTGFNPELTGRENIYLNGAILGMKKREVDRKIDEIIAFSEIEKHIDTPVKRYSSGMYVRLAFAVAAHLDSDILIADEVLAVGDASFQKKALGKMNELSSGQGRTVLFVSHNMSQVKRLCNKGMFINKGTLNGIDDEIDKSVWKYLQNDHIKETRIKDYIKKCSPILTIDDIYINGSDSCSIRINNNQKNFNVLIKGSSTQNLICDLMLIFKTVEGIPIATYSEGHYSGNTILINKGVFEINESILLPDYMGYGDCVMDLCLHRPGLEGYLDIMNSIYIRFEGNNGCEGHSLTISGNGFVGLHREYHG